MQKQSFEEIRKRKILGLEYGEPYKFDEHDKKIIKSLNEDARKSLAEISKEVGLSRDAVRERIRKMLIAKVIETFKPIVNPPKMGFPIINYVFLAFHNPTIEAEEKFLKYVMAHPQVYYVASLIGKWDYVLYLFCRNPGEFNLLMKTIRQKFPNLIKDYEVYGVLDELKYDEVGDLLYS